jgi:hypothetical protein
VLRIQGKKDSRFRIKELSIYPKKLVSKLSEIWSGMFIPDPDFDFLSIPDPGVKKAPDIGSGTITLQDTSWKSELYEEWIQLSFKNDDFDLKDCLPLLSVEQQAGNYETHTSVAKSLG